MQVTAEREISEHRELNGVTVGTDFVEERAELQRVLHHPEISRSISLVRFLTYICGKYFDHHQDEIREHTIAVHALGRKESTFDSQVDPIVRVTARALRKRLREYYDHEGKINPIEIVIPLGRYIPQFVPRDREAAIEHLAELSPVNPAPPTDQPISEVVAASLEHHEEVATEPALTPVASFAQRSLGRRGLLIAVLLTAFVATFYAGILLGRRTHETSAASSEAMKWGDPVWSDEFSGKAMDAPDASKWTFDVGSQNSWGNHELETYCAPGPVVAKACNPLHPNAFLDGAGHLVVRAQRDSDGNWTSARITTRGLRTFQYGRIEARLKLPVGMGLWPAFWMLGADFDHTGWPNSGAVDIVENVEGSSRSNGLGPSTIRASLHGPGYAGGDSRRSDYRLPDGGRVDDDHFHTYGIIWSPGMMQFYVDDPNNIFFVEDASSLPEGGQWVFDKSFSLVMNLAVGGDWSGDPDSTTPSKNDMVVDYVRVYRIPNIAPSLEWHPVQVATGTTTSSPVILRAPRGTGRVFLSCSAEPATAACTLESSTVDFSKSDSQVDALTILTDAVTQGKRVVAPPGSYHVTITATTMSGDRAQVTEPFEVLPAGH